MTLLSPLLGQNIPNAGLLTAKLPELGLQRAELFIIEESDFGEVKSAARQYGLTYSIHAPVPRPRNYPFPVTWTFLNYADPRRREMFFGLVESSIKAAKELNAQYVVVHFPGPITEECRLVGEEALANIAEHSANRLADLSESSGVPIHIEGFGPSPFFTLDFVNGVFREHPHLKYCFDVAHNHLAEQRGDIDYFAFLDAILPSLGSVHLWQARDVNDYVSYRHMPIHPAQTPEEGWVDVARVIRTVRVARPDVPYVMEYPGWFPTPWTHLDYRDGVTWLSDLITSS